ncbi:AAA ATPase midasin, partial [Coemansia erecta]
TGEVVRPHPHFMLFATQNPAGGAYGGRKALSRAFRNRFVELHFGDIPAAELQRIITDSCGVPPSHAELLVRVYGELTAARARTRIFEAAQGLVTLRDLFRWARRHAATRHELAQHGYMLLAERMRTPEDRAVVRRALERVLLGDTPERPRRIDVDALYSAAAVQRMDEYRCLAGRPLGAAVVWTRAMRRLFVLAALCARHQEPVLLVGATGCGKTTVCQMLAEAQGRRLHVLNCHQGSEASDVIGGQRPVRNRAALVAEAQQTLRAVSQSAADAGRVDTPAGLDALGLPADDARVQHARAQLERAQGLFAWHDGPLVQAMRAGDVFLMDELNLADDSVLERLNSALEPSRTLVLAEQAGGDQAAATVRAHQGFAFMATMNPGGDYGKRELSPALRNRFAEIWAPAAADPRRDADDLQSLLERRLQGSGSGAEANSGEAAQCARAILAFVTWLSAEARLLPEDALSLRDFLCWADFVRQARRVMPAGPAVVHGGCLVLLDALGAQGAAASLALRAGDAAAVKARCVGKLCALVGWDPTAAAAAAADRRLLLGVTPTAALGVDGAELAAMFARRDDGTAGVAPFLVPAGGQAAPASLPFALDAPTTFDNLVRVLRAMQVGKPLLLEGSPGVGKTALVSSLAQLAGHRLVRVNLSDQTDLMDLFGSDLPTASGGFAWCDAPFLQALRQGDWVLLDESNLASQSVLEGLNACLDHRAAVYIAELDREFALAPGFRLFAAQNPLAQGGGRKGLPRSFVNRFTQVFMHELQAADLQAICAQVHAHAAPDTRAMVLRLNQHMHQTALRRQAFLAGAPWEFNLRDVGRLLDALQRRAAAAGHSGFLGPDRLVDVLYVQRMRTPADRQHVRRLFAQAFGRALDAPAPALQMTPAAVQVGGAVLARAPGAGPDASPHVPRLRALHAMLPALEALATCVEMRWPAILVGPAGCGKTALVRWLAAAAGHRLVEFAMNAGVDTSEILGGFEQVDVQRHCTALARLAQRAASMAPLGASSERISRAAHAVVRAAGDRAALCVHVEALAALLEAQQQADAAGELRASARRLAALDAAGRFEWVDGVLVDALEHGHWLLLDHANLCSAAVLDRLNGLLEPNGVLYVSEDPMRTEPVVPHENFRIFMAVDPNHGELSRAMRNRGVEICLLPPGDSQDAAAAVMACDDQRVVARAVGVPEELLVSGDATSVRPEKSLTALVQQAMLVAERVQRGGAVMEEQALDSAAAEDALPVRAPDTVADAAVARAAWQADLLLLQHSAAAAQPQRMLLAALSTLAPGLQETQHLRAVLQALSLSSSSSAAAAAATAQHAMRLLADGAQMMQALAHVRGMIAPAMPMAHPDALHAAPAYLPLNHAVHQALGLMLAAASADTPQQQQQQLSLPLLAAWHAALSETLLLQRERHLSDLTSGEDLDLREHVLQRANIDIAFVQRIFTLLDACAALTDAWETHVCRPPVSPESARILPALVAPVRAVLRAKARIERLVAGSTGGTGGSGGDGWAQGSALAVAFEMLQLALGPLAAATAEQAPEEVRGAAAGLLARSVDALVRDASTWARLWAASHPVTLADPQARALELRLRRHLATADSADSADSASANAMAVEALAMLMATASRKDHRLVVAAVQRFVDSLAAPAAPQHSAGRAADVEQQQQQPPPATVLRQTAELGRWQDLVQHVAAASIASSSSSSTSDSTSTQLSLLVGRTQVDETSPWALVFTRLGWALGDGARGAALWPLLSDLAYQWLAALDRRPAPWRPVATELAWQQAARLDGPSLAAHADVLDQSRALLRELAQYRPAEAAAQDELAAALAMLTPVLCAACPADTQDAQALLGLAGRLLASPGCPEALRQWAARASSVDAALAPAVGSIAQALDALRSSTSDSTRQQLAVFRAVVECAAGQMAASVPRRAVDPAAKARTRWTWLADDIAEAQADLLAYGLVQRSLTGEHGALQTTPATLPFAQRLDALERQQAAIELVHRPEQPEHQQLRSGQPSFSELWQEARNLVDNVLGRARDLAASLADPPSSSAGHATMTAEQFGTLEAAAHAVVATLGQFEARVAGRYFDAFRDVAQLWCTPARLATYGLRRLVDLRRAAVLEQMRGHAELLAHVYRQPVHPAAGPLATIAGQRELLGRLKTLVFFGAGTSGSSPLRTYGRLLETLALRVVLSVHARGLLHADDRARLDAVLADAYEIHRRARDERLRREAEAASLFRSKTTKEQTDEELLAELFPGYEDVFEPAEALQDEQAGEPSFDDLPEDTVALLAACHQHVMLQYGGRGLHREGGVADQHGALVADAQRRAYALAAALYRLRPELARMHGAGLDAELRAANLVSLAQALTPAPGGVSAGVGMTGVYDFYRDAAPSEALLLKPLASAIIARVTFLADEWPDHAVLQQILDMCSRLLALPADTPLAKLLAAVEQLHTRAQDWQAFASRDVSIDELADVARLIVRWRQAELNSWPHLLRAQELAFARRPNELWFGLYAALIADADADADAAADGRAGSLVAAVDHFMQGSPAGEFRARLNMLCAFAVHTRSHADHESLAHVRLANAIDYYAQFAPCIEAQLEGSGKAIRKDLAQYVKISSWKDVNPAALRASAQKTHRHLARCVRRWREALSQPMFQIVQAMQAATVATARVPLVPVVALPLSDAGIDVRCPVSLASLCAAGCVMPWDALDALAVGEEDARAAAALAVSPQIARVLEASPAHMLRLLALMRAASFFGPSAAARPVDALDEFAQQIVGDVSYFQAVETPKHLVKPSARSAKKAASDGDQDKKMKKKNLIKTKRQKEAEEEQEVEYVEDDEERQSLIRRFWGEQRNLRRTRLKDILRGLQDLGLKRAARPVAAATAAAEASSASASASAGSATGDLASVLALPPLDLAAWQQSTSTVAQLHPAAVHLDAPRTLSSWQLANACFFRLCAQTAQLRTAAYAEHSAEVDAKQVLLILGLMDRLSTHVTNDRSHAARLLSQATRWMQASVGSTASPRDSEHAADVGLHALKSRVDCLAALMLQFAVSLRAVADAQGWSKGGARAAALATTLVDAAKAKLAPAAEQLAVVCAALTAIELAGADPQAALAQVCGLQQADQAVQAVSLAVDDVAAAMEQIAADNSTDPWLLAPWTEPIAQACTHVRAVLDESLVAADEPSQKEMAELAGQLATSVMVAWQEISQAQGKYDEAGTETNQWGLRPLELVNRMRLMEHMAHALHLPKVTELSVRLVNMLNGTRGFSPLASLVRSWTTRYSLIVQHVVALYAAWHRSLVHFALTTTAVLTTVIVHGLGTNDIYDSEETTESMQNGMGVGEGSTAGAKNVSDEIEGEDQVEGLQGEEPPEDANEPGTNEDAIEMENDFAGALGDADLETDNEDSDKDDDDDDEENEMDEQMGDVDPTDPTALDEKLWDDEEEDKNAEDDGKNDSKVDSTAKSKKEQTDIVAGEDEDAAEGDQNQGEQADDGDNDSQMSGSDGEMSDSDNNDDDDDELDDGVNRDTFDRMADVEEQGEQLEMPDDLDMDMDDDQASDDEQQDESDDGLDADMHDLPEDEPIERKPDAMDEDEENAQRQDGDEEHVKDDGDEAEQEQEQEQAEGDEADIAGDEGGEEPGSDSDDADKQGEDEEEEDEEGEDDDGRGDNETARNEDDAEENGANKPTEGIDSAMNLDGNDSADPNTTAESNDTLSKPSEAAPQNDRQQEPASSAMQQQQSYMEKSDSQMQQQQQQQEDAQQKRNLNPERTLADVIEKWERRLNLVMREKEEDKQQPEKEEDVAANDAQKQQQQQQDSNDAPEDNDAAVPEGADFEHVNEDEQFDKIALADADEQDFEKQREQQQHQPMDIDEEEDDAADADKGQDDDGDADMKDANDAVDEAAPNAAARPAVAQTAPQQLSAANNDDDNAMEAAQMQQATESAEAQDNDNDDEAASDADADEADQTVVDIVQLREELEQQTAAWRDNQQDSERAMDLWLSYKRLTNDLSLMLTEQLRLVLTPTQATQLRGDYRTGKRLNMKRIIPYIASDFRKDKIWLRRTKPARREYQVMVALDNSRSMAQNAQGVELAYETLALVTSALTQLEAGQLSVVSFGEQVNLLHPFDAVFDNEAGARVLSRFTFADERTDVVQLMDASLQLFDVGATSSSAADLWRLQLVISDGMCHDHPRLLRQVRAAMEKRIMTVFIMLDRSEEEGYDPETQSIMNRMSYTFATGADGKMELKGVRFLDTFPFKYYVVLRDIHGLPSVLAETLRQYFSLVATD